MVWVQYHPLYIETAKQEWERLRNWDFDTSHEISDLQADGVRRKIAEFRYSDDAAIVEKLVNAFKRGDLMIRTEIAQKCTE